MKNNFPYSTNILNNISFAKKMRSEAIKNGIISPEWEWLLTSVIYDKKQLKELEKKLSIIESIMNEIWRSKFHQIDELLNKLKIPKWMKKYIF